MKYLDYMLDHPTENLDLCKPYLNDSGDSFLILHGGTCDAIGTPDGVIYDPSETDIREFARHVNHYYDDYRGYDGVWIAIQAMREVGCASCPLRDDCDAMDDELDGDDDENEPPTYKVVMVSMGGTRKDMYTGLSYEEALEICESYNWEIDLGYVWDLDIEEED